MHTTGETGDGSRWVIVSNRLPFGYSAEMDRLEPSAGGLVTAITGIHTTSEMCWAGVAPDGMSQEVWERHEEEAFATTGRSHCPVFLEPELYDAYYNSFCNNVLWPLFHYETSLVEFKDEAWEAYREVNVRFADALSQVLREGDLLWIHDFHLFLLPKLIKDRIKNIRCGFFLHTPFPSSEIFRQLPARTEILKSVIQADLIGFHDYGYLRHFCSAVSHILGIEADMLSIVSGEHVARLGVFPVSIDTEHFRRAASSEDVRRRGLKLKRGQRSKYLVLGVDRLDYIKGIELKLKAFGALLERRPEMQGQVTLLQVAVPTRTDVPTYRELRAEIERLVGEINGRFGRPNYVPVQYMFSSVEFSELLALYRQADVLLVTSKRDGMNLVALEYLASQPAKGPGVVVLSEFAGAFSTLSHVLTTNPWDVSHTAEMIFRALHMGLEEKVSRHRCMIDFLNSYTASDWAGSFVANLEEAGGPILAMQQARSVWERTKEGNCRGLDLIREDLRGRRVVVFCDYDGTLVPIEKRPEAAVLSSLESVATLKRISEERNIDFIVVSGRDRRFLARQFSGGNLANCFSLCAEHGATWFDQKRGKWQTLVQGGVESWYGTAETIINDYVKRVPDSFIEKKRFGVSWHYRLSPKEFGHYQARRLKQDLEETLIRYPVSVLAGKKVIEVRAVEASKGRFIAWYLGHLYDGMSDVAIIALGDDQTDEDMFNVVNARNGISIKVGYGITAAKYRLSNSSEVYRFFEELIDVSKSVSDGYVGRE